MKYVKLRGFKVILSLDDVTLVKGTYPNDFSGSRGFEKCRVHLQGLRSRTGGSPSFASGRVWWRLAIVRVSVFSACSERIRFSLTSYDS